MTRAQKLTKKWEANFEKLKACRREDETFEIEDDYLRKWIKKQNGECKCFKENRQSKRPRAFFDENIRRLQGIGFVFTLNGGEHGKRLVPRTWEEGSHKLKAYMDGHGGSWEVDAKDTENAKLRNWLLDQQIEYRKLHEGRESSITQEIA